MAAEPIAAPVRVKEPVLLPAGIATLGGLKVTSPPGNAESATVAPAAGAGVLSVMVPPMVCVTPTPDAFFANVIEMDCDPTVIEAVADK
jgi:hypothetical protein